MKNKKRISLILVFAMVIQLFTASFVFAQEQAVKTPVATEEFKFFNTLNMLIPADTLYAGENMTRAQFGYIAARLIGYDGEIKADAHFTDVSAESVYANAINYLYDMGIVRGTGNGLYQPETPITFNDASAIIVKILGYDKIASAKYGAYPLCNIRMADALDIYLDIKMPVGTDPITTEQALIMLKNVIYAPMAIMSVYGDEASTYTYDATKTLLYVYHDIVRAEGVVTDDSITSISGTTALKKGGAIIGGKKLNPSTNGFTVNGLLGAYVDYWYIENTNELVYAEVNVDATSTLTITFDDLAINSSEYTLTNVVYYENEDKTDNARIAMTADFIYNGALYNTYTLDDLKIESGFMSLIDRNDDDIYDIVNVTEYTDYIVTGLSKENNVIYTKEGTIELDKYDVATIVNHKNTEISISDMFAGNIMSVAASKDNSNITIVYGNAPAQGVVTKAETTENVYYMGEIAYELSNAFVKNAKPSDYPEVGNNYKFYINADGFVADVEMLDSDAWYKGYLIGVGGENQGSLETTAIAGILTKNNVIVKYYVGDKITLNGKKVTASNLPEDPAVYDSASKLPIRQPVKYKLDEWGELKEIETPVNIIGDPNYPNEYDLERFSKDKIVESAAWKGDKINALQGGYFTTNNTFVIYDPYLNDTKGAFKTEDVEIVPFSEYSMFTSMSNAEIYDIDENRNMGFICYSSTIASGDKSADGYWQRSLFVVDSVYRAVLTDDNGDTEKVKVVSGVLGGKEVKYYENTEKGKITFDSLRNGDVLLINIEGNYMLDYQFLASLNKLDKDGKDVAPLEPGLIYSNGGSAYFDERIVIFGSPVCGNSDSGVVVFGWDENKLVGYSYSGTPGRSMTIYDRETGKLSSATCKDIYTNVVADSHTAPTYDEYTPRVIVYGRWGYVCDMIFIK